MGGSPQHAHYVLPWRKKGKNSTTPFFRVTSICQPQGLNQGPFKAGGVFHQLGYQASLMNHWLGMG